MTKQDVLNYYKEWSTDVKNLPDFKKDKNQVKSSFLNMLQAKATFAKQTGKTLYAYDGAKTGEELEQMLIIATDNISELK